MIYSEHNIFRTNRFLATFNGNILAFWVSKAEETQYENWPWISSTSFVLAVSQALCWGQ